MRKKKASIISLGAAIFVSAIILAAFADDIFAKKVGFETVEWQDFYSGLDEKENIVIKDRESWNELWGRAHAGNDAGLVMPEIDFNSQMIVAVAMGEKQTGGYRTQITKITDKKDSVKIYVAETSPGEKCFTAEAVSRPYHIVKMEKSDKKVEFNFRQTVNSCK